MVSFQWNIIFVAVVAAQAAHETPARPRPTGLAGPASLGIIIPHHLTGWGWNLTTTPPPETTTTGWPAEIPTEGWGWSGWTGGWTGGWTTIPPPESTTGWPVETTTQGWGGWETTTTPPPETTTQGWGSGWDTTTTAPPETTTGWPVVETTTTTTPGWSVETTTGWSTPGWQKPTTPSPGWPGPPPTPSGWGGWTDVGPVEIEMVGESAAVGEGESGATHASHTSILGDETNPALAQLQSGSHASLAQAAGNVQISGIGTSGESSTYQGNDVYNTGDAGEYYTGSLSGTQINLLNSGSSYVLGQGAIGQSGITHNSVLHNDGVKNDRK